MNQTRCYVIIVKSESGDHYGPYLFAKKPDDDALEKFLRCKCPGEWEDGEGPGFRDSYLHVQRCGWRDIEF